MPEKNISNCVRFFFAVEELERAHGQGLCLLPGRRGWAKRQVRRYVFRQTLPRVIYPLAPLRKEARYRDRGATAPWTATNSDADC